jgi:hypothetical protein
MANVLKFEFNKPETVELQTTQTLDVSLDWRAA